MTLTMSLLVLMTLTMGGQLSGQVHTAPRLNQVSDSEMCVGTLKAYTVRIAVKILYSFNLEFSLESSLYFLSIMQIEYRSNVIHKTSSNSPTGINACTAYSIFKSCMGTWVGLVKVL